MAGFGKYSEVNKICAECGSILPPEEHGQEGAQIIRRAHKAGNSGNWESFKDGFREIGELCEWTIERLQEACRSKF